MTGTPTMLVNSGGTAAVALSLGAITGGSNGLIKDGSGALLLTAADIYSGGTTIDAGTVVLGDAAALGTGGLTMTGGTLDLNAHSITVASLSGTAPARSPDNAATAGTSTLTVSQSTTTSFAGTLADGARVASGTVLQRRRLAAQPAADTIFRAERQSAPARSR